MPSKRCKRRVIAQQLVTERKVRGKGNRTVNGREEDEEEEKARIKEWRRGEGEEAILSRGEAKARRGECMMRLSGGGEAADRGLAGDVRGALQGPWLAVGGRGPAESAAAGLGVREEWGRRGDFDFDFDSLHFSFWTRILLNPEYCLFVCGRKRPCVVPGTVPTAVRRH